MTDSRFKRQKHGYKVTVKTEGVNKIIKYLIYFFLLTDSLFAKLYSFDCCHVICLLMHYSGRMDDFLVCVLCLLRLPVISKVYMLGLATFKIT